MANILTVSKRNIFAKFKTIEQAVEQASEGDIIELGPGTYEEHIRTDKGLQFLAKDHHDAVYFTGKLIIDANTETKIDSIVFQNEAEIKVREGQVHISNCKFLDTIYNPISVEQGAILKIDHIECEGNDYPLFIAGSASITNSSFTSFNHGVILLKDGSHLFIEDSSFTNGKDAIYAEESVHLQVASCRFANYEKNAVTVNAASTLQMMTCTFSNNKENCVTIKNSAIDIQDCHFTKGASAFIYIEDQSSGKISSCQFQESEKNGLLIEASTIDIDHCLFKENKFPQIMGREKATLTINHTEIMNGKGNGLRFIGDCEVEMNHCKVHNNVDFPQMSIENAGLNMSHSSIHTSTSNGILLEENARASFSHVSIHGHEKAHISAYDSQVYLDNCSLKDGSSNAIYAKGGNVYMKDSLLSHQVSAQVLFDGDTKGEVEGTKVTEGASNAFSIREKSSLIVEDSEITHHSESKYPTIFMNNHTHLQMNHSSLLENEGTALYLLTDGQVNIVHSRIEQNKNTDQVYISTDGDIKIDQTFITNGKENGIYIDRGHPQITYSIIAGHPGENVSINDENEASITTKHSVIEDPTFLLSGEEPEKKAVDPVLYEEESYEQLMEELEAFIGLQNVKEYIKQLAQMKELMEFRQERGLQATELVAPHIVFTGNPGTGKTTIARYIGKIFASIGLLEKGHLVEVKREDLVGKFIGHSEDFTREKIEEALGGVLFIDEAYALASEGDVQTNDFGQKVIDVLLPALENYRGQLTVIVAGYEDEMTTFLTSNPGLESRFTETIHFHDYEPNELLEIFYKNIQEEGYLVTKDAADLLYTHIVEEYRKRDRNFSNARYIRNFFEQLKLTQTDRIMKVDRQEWSDELISTFHLEDVERLVHEDDRSAFNVPINETLLEENLTALHQLIGLDHVKKKIEQLVDLNRYYRENGKDRRTLVNHMLLVGNPGTGKTEVGRLIAGIYEALGLLDRGELFEVDRQALVGMYMGESEKKTKEQIEEAMGSTLFIDEAYTLTNKGPTDPGKASVETLLKAMSDNEGEFMVLAAGYKGHMEEFLQSNPGLTRRFTEVLEFHDYTPEQLMDIFELHMEDYVLTEEAYNQVLAHFTSLYKERDEHFGNAGLARKIALQAMRNVDYRMAQLRDEEVSEAMKKTITLEDVFMHVN